MARFNRKMSKLKNKIKQADKNIQALQLKEKMTELVKKNEYVDAMDVMAQLADMGIMDIDVMYMGAYCYMMTGDNERAVKWINNVLSCAPNNIKARILLGRICVAEDKEEDALKIFELVLKNMKNGLDEEDNKELEDILDFYRYSDTEKIIEEYPTIAAFLELEADDDGQIEDVPQTENLKIEEPQVKDIPQATVTTVSQKDEPVVEEKKDDSAASRARAAVERLRNLLNNKKQVSEEKVEAKVEEQVEQVRASVEEKMQEETVAIENPESEEKSVSNTIDIDSIAEQIMAKPVSLVEKIKMFNGFAAGCYMNKDYQSAFELLDAALNLDSGDVTVLKNIAYVCAAAGEKDQAMEYVARLPMIDFATLNDINKL